MWGIVGPMFWLSPLSTQLTNDIVLQLDLLQQGVNFLFAESEAPLSQRWELTQVSICLACIAIG